MRELRADCSSYLGGSAYLRRLCAVQELSMEPVSRRLMADIANCACAQETCYAVCSNAALIYLAAYSDGSAVFESAGKVLECLSLGDIADLAALYYESFGGDGDMDA